MHHNTTLLSMFYVLFLYTNKLFCLLHGTFLVLCYIVQVREYVEQWVFISNKFPSCPKTIELLPAPTNINKYICCCMFYGVVIMVQNSKQYFMSCMGIE